MWLEGARLGLQVLVQQRVELLLLLRAARELQLLLELRQPRVPPLCARDGAPTLRLRLG